jgi:ABC-type amino acid transport substrate-binding protein
MKTNNKLLSVLLAAILSTSLLLAGCSGSDTGKLTIGASGAWPIDSTEEGIPSGFEYELMGALADDMGLELEYIPYTDYINQVTLAAFLAKYDAMASGMYDYYSSPGPHYGVPNNVCKSIPYYEENRTCLVRQDSEIPDVASLTGKVVGVRGTEGQIEGLDSLAEIVEVRYFLEESAGLAALQAGIIDAYLVDEADTNDSYGLYDSYPNLKPIGVVPTGHQYVLVFGSGDTEIQEAVNASLQHLIDNGTYAKIFSKYFSYEPTITPQ